MYYDALRHTIWACLFAHADTTIYHCRLAIIEIYFSLTIACFNAYVLIDENGFSFKPGGDDPS